MKFSEIIGQDLLKQRLIKTVVDNRISHAQLFLGSEGCGKLALALAYAQYINCSNRSGNDSCGVCPSCIKYNHLTHPDLHFIFPINKTKEVDSTKIYSKDFLAPWREFLLENQYYVALTDWYEKIGIEKKQGLINADDADSVSSVLQLHAYEAEYKVVVIWMPEKMNLSAANKLLKILEEPPGKTLFCLIAEESEQILPTIWSRTQLIKVPSLSDSEISRELQAKCNQTPAQADTIARVADGNFHFALKQIPASAELSPVSSRKGKETRPKEQVHFEIFCEWMRQCYKISDRNRPLNEYSKLETVVEKILFDGSREQQKEFILYSLKILRSCFQYHIGNAALVRQTEDEMAFIKNFASFAHPNNINELTDTLNLATIHVERNVNGKLIFTDLSHSISILLRKPALPQYKKM